MLLFPILEVNSDWFWIVRSYMLLATHSCSPGQIYRWRIILLLTMGNLYSSGQIYRWRIILLLTMGIYTVQVRYTSGGSFYYWRWESIQFRSDIRVEDHSIIDDGNLYSSGQIYEWRIFYYWRWESIQFRSDIFYVLSLMNPWLR